MAQTPYPSIRHVTRIAKTKLAKGITATRNVMPSARLRNSEIAGWRTAAESRLAAIAASQILPFSGTVLLDGMFDNANYWYRLSLLRGALGLASGHQVGITGPHNARSAGRMFTALGVNELAAFDKQVTADDRRDSNVVARQLVAATDTPADVLSWKLPYDMPAEIVYDGLLKAQRLPSVDPRDPGFLDLVVAALVQIHAAARLVERHSPDLLVLSHSCQIRYGALAHLAVQRGIPAIVAFGNYGVPRYFRLDHPEDLFDPTDSPRGRDLDQLNPEIAAQLAKIGRDHLAARRAGTTDDIGSQYAFSSRHGPRDRAEMTATLGWDPSKAIVAVYAANWFDFPHYMGMNNFHDFSDFILATLHAADANTEVNWLFRRHPVDDFYGGKTLSDVLPADLPGHIAICPADWDSNDVMTNADAIVTYHGTIGVEAAAAGTPILVADRGWYHDCGFVTWPGDRDSYIATLGQFWWHDADIEERRHRAEIFAGWYFAAPSWQHGLVCGDDSRQAENYPALARMLDEHQGAALREMTEIAKWWQAGTRFYHTAKMRNADTFSLGNVVGA